MTDSRIKPSSIKVEPDLRADLEIEAKRRGVGWTTALKLLARQAIETNKARGA